MIKKYFKKGMVWDYLGKLILAIFLLVILIYIIILLTGKGEVLLDKLKDFVSGGMFR